MTEGINKQAPMPARAWDGVYSVHSIFHTVQGEGPFSGDAAAFVRLAGCNIQCPWCDTDYTSETRAGLMTAAEVGHEVVTQIGDAQTDLIVITGGEPFRQDLTDLVRYLRGLSYRVQIETNGTLDPSDRFKEYCEANFGVAIVVSPKAQFVHPWLEQHAIAYKYVLTYGQIDPDDGLPITVLGRGSQRVARPLKGIPHIFIQPADMGDNTRLSDLSMGAVVQSAIRFGHRLQLQIHKYLGVE